MHQIKGGSKRPGYNLVPTKEQPSWRNQRRVLCTRSQDQHIEHEPADGERLLGSDERSSTILERQDVQAGPENSPREVLET